MTVHVFVQKVAELTRATCVTRLRAERAQPHEIAGFNFDTVIVEVIDRLTFKHIEPVI